MRILYIVGRLGMGGDSTAILNTLSVLIKQKKIKEKDIFFLTHDIGYNQRTVNELRKKGYKVYILPGDVRKMGPINYFVAVYKLLNQEGPFDVVHTHTSLQAGIALLAAKMCHVPKRVCHAHTNSIQRKTLAVLKNIVTPFLKFLINFAATDKVACGKMAGEFLYGKYSFQILKNGINLNAFREVSQKEINKIRGELLDNNNQLLVGHIGRFSEMKNQKFIVFLAERMKGSNIKFILVGDGEEYKKVRQMTNEEDVSIRFLGRRGDIPQLLMAFDLLLLPSLPGEGFPVTLVEAQAAGCPCIVSTNVTKESDLGLNLISFADLDNIQEWIKQIYTNYGKRISRDVEVQRIENLGFDQTDVANEWFRIYGDVLR